MGGLIIILPVVAFDLWLLLTTGTKQMRLWKQARDWRRFTWMAAIGVALGVWLAFFFQYGWDARTRAKGFPIPDSFSYLQNGQWSVFLPPPSLTLQLLGVAANFLTGLVAPFFPYKIAEFVAVVKAELHR